MGIKEESTKPLWGNLSHSPSSYALNGKIMLSSVIILFVAVLMILCFHTYARFLFQRQNRHVRRRVRAHLRSLSASTTVPSSLTPLDPTVLEKIPVFLYSSKSPLEECSVCLSEFEEEEQGRVLPKCGHVFHVDCIDTWFRSKSTCPLCRAPVQFKCTEPVEPVKDVETGSSSSVRFPMEACEREPLDLTGITVEIPTSNPGRPNQTGSKFPVLSLKRLWSI